ncbi:MAG: putative MaoC-like dehydratase [Gaiellaceae bacterium]|nr:putative MaoC-like dehydratase [Gaiellaceae bacterium]
MPAQYFEDFRPGQTVELGSRTVTEEEIVAFARQWDPQPFHTDAEAARDSVFGGLIASGWHTGAMWMRLYVDSLLGSSASQGSPGVEELRWLAPVRPGDTLTGRLEVLEAVPSERRPDRGTVRIRAEMVNQDGVTVMSMTSRGHFGRRP